MSKSKFTLNIESALKKLCKKTQSKKNFSSEYFVGKGQSQLKFFNLTTPQVRSVLKNKDLFPPQASPNEVYQDIEKMWLESEWFEARTICFIWLESQTDDFLLSRQKNLIKWASQIDNWAHSDSLCNFLSQIYENDSKYLGQIFLKWHQHKNPWYRRISLVSLFYYSRLRKQQPKYFVAEKFVKANLLHADYYVQKAVGWTLREMYNAYPEKTLRFLDNNVHSISSTAWVASTEKLHPNIKNNLMKKRKIKVI